MKPWITKLWAQQRKGLQKPRRIRMPWRCCQLNGGAFSIQWQDLDRLFFPAGNRSYNKQWRFYLLILVTNRLLSLWLVLCKQQMWLVNVNTADYFATYGPLCSSSQRDKWPFPSFSASTLGGLLTKFNAIRFQLHLLFPHSLRWNILQASLQKVLRRKPRVADKDVELLFRISGRRIQNNNAHEGEKTAPKFWRKMTDCSCDSNVFYGEQNQPEA